VDECGVCHTPENEFRPATPPLWDSRADLTKRFGKSAISAAGPGMGTRSCLNCHDGTIATDATGAVRGGRFAHTNQLTGFTTGHGRSDHPVGIAYPAFDEDYHPPTMVVAGWKVTLPDGKVECASCHDPHNNSGEKHMLVMNNARSALCLKCHVK
jgi:predicted CXXCH cytochrome family protein